MVTTSISNLTPDSELVHNIKENGCSNSLQALYARHSGLCAMMFKTYSTNYITGSNSDYVADSYSVIYEAAKNYNPDKGTKFSTYLGNNFKFHFQNNRRKSIKESTRTVSSDDSNFSYLVNELDSQKVFPNQNSELLKYIFHILEQLKDKRILEIFKLRYLSDDKKKRTWKSIAKELSKKQDISYEHVRQLHNHAVDFLKEKLKSENISDII